jgi:ribosomal protein S18 acetylase RimI-like enzyme
MRAESPANPIDARVDAAPAIPGLTFRNARPDDWATVTDVVNAARAADGVDQFFVADALRAEYEPMDWFDIGRDVLIAEIDGETVGTAFGWRVQRGTTLALESWGVVLAEHRHQGIGSALHRATRTRLAVEAAADPRPGERSFRSWALDIERSDRTLLLDEGYVPIRFGFEMRRFLTGDLPEHFLPDGLELRPVTPEQHRAIFDADNEAFRDHWGHREQDEGDFHARYEHPETDTSLWCVAWDGDQVAGSVVNAIFLDENRQLGLKRGWLEHVSVRRQWRGRGVAKALCAASFRVLRDRGIEEAWLGVDGSNPTGALQLYEGLGFEVARRWQALGRPLDGPADEGWRPEGDEPA